MKLVHLVGFITKKNVCYSFICEFGTSIETEKLRWPNKYFLSFYLFT